VIRAFLKSLFTAAPEPPPPPTHTGDPKVTLSSPLPVAEPALTVEDVCRAMYADGYSIREVAREMGLSYYMARKHVSAK
jgi:hypothetical protein